MGLREELSRRIERKHQEIMSLEVQLREANAYVQALEDTIKLLPREELNRGQADMVVRPGGYMMKARDAILKAGKPLHVQELLVAVGKPQTKEARATLTGSLSAYVRRKEIFTRPFPNTFGLMEIEAKTEITGNGHLTGPPAQFGGEEEVTAD